MKKLIIGLLVLGLIVVAVLGFTNSDLLTKTDKTSAETAPAAEPAAQAETPAEEEGPTLVEAGGVDYDAIYALHAPEEVVMTVDGKDVTWQEYFYCFYNQAKGMEQNFQMYQSYGMAMGWESQANEAGQTFADLVDESAEKTMRSLMTVRAWRRKRASPSTRKRRPSWRPSTRTTSPISAARTAPRRISIPILRPFICPRISIPA